MDRHAAVERNRVKGVGEAVLHVILKVDAAGGADAVKLGADARGDGAAGQVAGGGAVGEAGVGVRGHARDGGDGVVALGRRHGVLAVGRVLVTLAGDVDGHGVAGGVVVARHDVIVVTCGLVCVMFGQGGLRGGQLCQDAKAEDN